MPEIRFMWAKPEDVKQIFKKYHEFFHRAHTEPYTAFVAKDRNRVVAFAVFDKNYLLQLFVLNEFRKGSFSDRFLESMIQAFFRRFKNYHKIWGTESSKDQKSKALARWCKMHGFEEGAVRDKFEITREKAAQIAQRKRQQPRTPETPLTTRRKPKKRPARPK